MSASVPLAVLPVPAVSVDGTGSIIEANAAFLGAYGQVGPGDPLSHLALDRSSIDRALADPSSTPVTVEVDGQPHRATLTVVAGDQGTVAFVQPTLADPGAMRDVAAKAHDLLGQGVVVGDGTRVLYVSKAAAAVFGRPVEELLARGSLFGLFQASEQERIRGLVAERMARDEPVPQEFETVVERPDGSLLPVEIAVKAVVERG